LTRCAEPLFVFVFATLAMRHQRRVRLMRWLQLLGLSVLTSVLISRQVGYAMVDILVSLAVAAPAAKFAMIANRRRLLFATYALAVLAAFPFALGGVAFDYSPFLVAYQILLVRFTESTTIKAGTAHGVASGVAVIATALLLTRLQMDTLPTVLVVAFGHPLALAVIHFVQADRFTVPEKVLSIARWPLTVYGSHLVILALASP
jgi:hypothetical protein